MSRFEWSAATLPIAWASSAAAVLALVTMPAIGLATTPASASALAPKPLADRSRELLDYRCANSLGVRQVTLFANGTVRLREGLGKEPKMLLGEIGPVELAGYLRRLAAEDLSEVHDRQESTEGEWVEHCTFHLTLDGAPERLLSFSRYDSLPLQLAAVVRVADEVAAKTRATTELPAGYHARVGDVLRRADGVLFAVMGFTSDGVGIELEGVEQPLVVYVRPEDVPSQFEALVSRQMP
ncbi:MAG TPA: hypothetical protein VGS57_17395 [Thermoanaerobaculia bacterium]|nr:hypothetical protein [Thermoanaerobaculia bacterium]